MLGGAFDPVHVGHVLMALGCMEVLDLQEVHFIPVGIPPHKSAPGAAQQHRLAMLERALRHYPQLLVNDMELKREGVSYTIDTLIDLRRGNALQPFCFIMGMDAFESLPTWRRWQELTDYAHLILIDRRRRDDRRLDERLQAHYTARSCSSPAILHAQSGGCIHKTILSIPDVSSSEIRALLSNDENTGEFLSPDVHNYIKENNLYA